MRKESIHMPIQFQRLTSLALACALMLSLSVPALAAQEGEETTEPTSPRATAQDDGTFLRGSFTFGPHENTNDLTDTFIYSDDYFSGSSYTANEHLATMSMQMAAASISSEDTNDYTDKSQNVQALLTALGFQDVQVNGYYKQQMQQNTMGVAVAYKKLNDDTVLLAIVPRSAGYEKEGAVILMWGQGKILLTLTQQMLRVFKGPTACTLVFKSHEILPWILPKNMWLTNLLPFPEKP